MTKVALVVGHSAKHGGAVNLENDISEFIFNDELAYILADKLTLKGLEPVIVYRDTYTGLPDKVNALNPDIVISMHCNAFNKNTDGTEVLYHHTSTKGKLLAESLIPHILGALGTKSRGAKPIDYSHVGGKGDRGGWLVEKTKAVAVIVEPFFIDYTPTLMYAMENMDGLAQAYLDGILDYLEKI